MGNSTDSFFKSNDWVMDTEVYPNVILYQFINILTEERRMFCVLLVRSSIGKMMEKWYSGTTGTPVDSSPSEFVRFLTSKRLYGYNFNGFDAIILNSTIKLLRQRKQVIEATYKWGQLIIKYHNPHDMPKNLQSEAFSLFYPKAEDLIPYEGIDLAAIVTGNGGRFPSLKAIGVALKWNKLQDLPLDPTKPVKADDLKTLVSYGWNDVQITRVLAFHLESELRLRYDLSQYYHTGELATLNSSRSKLTNVLFEKLYKGKLEITQEYIERKANERIKISDIVAPNVKYTSPVLRKFIAEFSKRVIVPGVKGALDVKVEVGGVVFKLGVGGLHSVDGPGVFHNSDTVDVVDADVTSYYPMIIINLMLCPEHLESDEFLTTFKDIIDQRVLAKANAKVNPLDGIKAEALKITINGMTGKFNSRFWKVYDPKVYYTMTLNGQLYLLMLVDKLHSVGIQVLSANTDGVTALVKSHQQDIYKQVCQEWMDETKFNLEFAHYVKYARRDVNNYIAVTTYGSTKAKGIFVTKPDFAKGNDAMAVRKAVTQHLESGVDMMSVLKSCDVYDFMYSQNVGNQFEVLWRGQHGDRITQRKNRYYVVKPTKGIDYGSLVKRNVSNHKETALVAGKILYLANDVDDTMPEPDYNYYMGQCMDLLSSVIGQPRLF
jgi:hypothetical protein